MQPHLASPRPHLLQVFRPIFAVFTFGLQGNLGHFSIMVTNGHGTYLLEAFPSYKLNMYILNGTPRTSFEPRRFFATWTWIRLARETQALVQDLFTCTWTPPRSPL